MKFLSNGRGLSGSLMKNEIIPINLKTLIGSAEGKAVHNVYVWSTCNKLVLGRLKTED